MNTHFIFKNIIIRTPIQILFVIAINISLITVCYGNKLKVDPQLNWLSRMYQSIPKQEMPVFLSPSVKLPRDEEELRFTVFIIPHDRAQAGEDIRSGGGEILRMYPGFIAARITPFALGYLREAESIKFITPVRRVRPQMDMVLPLIGADVIHDGSGNAFPSYRGRNIVIGTVDTGIDLSHPDFHHDDGSTRILSLWDHTQEDGNPPDGFDYGKECSVNLINEGNCGEEDGFSIDDVLTLGHGTHVAGIAAGNDPDYTGLAPEAHLIVAKVKMDELSLLDGAHYIASKVRELDLPAVINISLGTNEGPHDGTSVLELGITELAGPGLVLTVSGGNEGGGDSGQNLIHLSYPADDEPAYTKFCPQQDNLGLNAIMIETWYHPPASGNELQFAVGVEDGNSESLLDITAFTSSGQTTVEESLYDDADTVIAEVYIDAPLVPNPSNNARQALIILSPPDDSIISSLHSYDWVLAVKTSQPGESIPFDAWINSDNAVFEAFSGPGPENATAPVLSYVGGDDEISLVIPATARNVFSVGSFVSRDEWTDASGSPQFRYGVDVGEISSFSSLGPTRDLRQKPEFIAPGEVVASAFSASVGSATPYRVDNFHSVLSGSSMATPVLSGALALMLERNPGLDYENILNLLADYALSDEYTGPTPNYTAGYGKLDLEGVFDDPDLPDTAVPDTFPPTITGGSTEIRITSLIATWHTDEIASSQVWLRREGDDQVSVRGTQSYTTEHQMRVPDLNQGTDYLITLVSTDPSGNQSRSETIAVHIPGGSSGCGCSTQGNHPENVFSVIVLAVGIWLLMKKRRNRISSGFSG